MDSMDSEKLIVELNYKNEIIDERKKAGSFNSEKMFALLPESIVDKRTLKLIEIHDLFKAFDHSLTFVGSAKLFHSLVNPSESIELIHAKQDSFCEVESNDTLKNAITDYLETFRIGEPSLFKLLNAHLHPLLPYRDFNRAMETIKGMQKAARAIPQPETVYLDSLIKSILSFSGSPVSSLVEGKAYRTLSGIRSKEEKHMLIPALRFRSGRLSGGTILPSMPAVYFGAGWLLGFMDPLVAKSLLLLTGGGSILGLVYGALFKPMFDYETAVLPIRRRIIESNRLASAVEAVAEIDELLSFVLYSQSSRHPTVIPEITNNPTHSFVAKELRNPTIAKGNEHFVANDVDLNGCKVTFITGPNSGGKTTYCKTIVQNQILGQIGAPIAARAAKINMADKITYQAPAFDSLNDPEGRFGTELVGPEKQITF
jgi:hypothetical protein